MESKAADPATLKLEARGAAVVAPLRLSLVIIGDGAFASHPLAESGHVVLGRGDDVDVRVDDVSISRKHAILHLGQALSIEDLGSANGTTVGQQRLAANVPVAIRIGEVIELGAVMLVVQQAKAGIRPTRVWTHEYFEGRLADECARAGRKKGTFAVVRVNITGPVAFKSSERQAALARALRPGDIIATYAPDEYELLLVEASHDEIEQRVLTLRVELEADAERASAGIACYPRDGLSPEALVDFACRQVRGAGRAAGGGGRGEKGDSDPVAAKSGPMRQLEMLIGRIAASTISVLLLGETGVGKEVMAAAVHRLSPRRDKPFVRLNCGALTETLLESELFGHERGAFTGAVGQKQGLLETAEGGTVFLDEVGELPLSLQVKLLRVLEAREVLRVGGLRPRRSTCDSFRRPTAIWRPKSRQERSGAISSFA